MKVTYDNNGMTLSAREVSTALADAGEIYVTIDGKDMKVVQVVRFGGQATLVLRTDK